MGMRLVGFKWIFLFWGFTLSFTSSGEISGSALLVQTNYSGGFIGPDNSYSERCQVFQDRVVIDYGLGGSVVSETRQLSNGASLKKLISRASEEQLTLEDNFLCDGPSSSIMSYSRGMKIKLYSTGGCGAPQEKRLGVATDLLLTFLGKFCSKPF